MKVAIYALTSQGLELGARIQKYWLSESSYEAELFGPERLFERFPQIKPFRRLSLALKDNFSLFPGHVVIGAIGLTVRLLAPLIKDKRLDPAVVGVGQDGQYAVSLLSGHLGGANELTKAVALASQGQAVITTATDLADQPALEVIARQLSLAVEKWPNLAPLARSLAEGEAIQLHDPLGILSSSLKPWPQSFKPFASEAEPSLWVDYREPTPPNALVFRPKVLAVGLGGHRGLEASELAELVDSVFRESQLSQLAIKTLATIDRRAEEKGFQEFAQKLGAPLLAFDPSALGAIKTPNPSPVVRENIGVDSVCEAAALLAAPSGSLLVPKRKSLRATCAVALISCASLA
jgi:cobalt-precorrin 5A hydrolase